MKKYNKEKILKAGKISAQVKKYARSIIKKDMPLLEIAEKIDARIAELGAKPAFPVNLSINNIAAHYTPSYDDKTLAHGLMKVDIGIHVDGWVSDSAFSIDFENSDENKKIIEASKNALENVKKLLKSNPVGTVTTGMIGKTVQETIESLGLSPIANLSGHSIEHYLVHAGLTIPNVNNKSTEVLGNGLYAVEPFATNGNGKIHDGKPSGIYMLISEKNIRSPIARDVLKYIIEEYNTLPFCSRWLVKKFGTKALFGIKQLEENGNLHNYAQLIESSGGIVSQAEHTFFLDDSGVIVTTEED